MSLKKAARLYRAFREGAPRRVKRVAFKMPSAVMVMGHCDAIEYSTTHGGKAKLYRHDFAPGSKPLLCAGTDKGQLFLIGGRFKVTARGIVDLDARQRLIFD